MRTLIVSIAALSLAACVQDVGKGHVKAKVVDAPAETVSAPTEAKPATPANANAKTHKVDAAKSSIKALGAKVTATHPIIFHTFDGSVSMDGDALAGVTFSADINSLEADHPKLTTHMKGEDFLWGDKHPKATFTSTGVKTGSSEEGFTHTVTGDINIRGVSKTIEIPAKVNVSASSVDASSEFVLDRQWFGVTYPGKADNLVQDNVRMTVQFHAPRS